MDPADPTVPASEARELDGTAPLDRGTIVGRYVVLSMLGAGGMGVVYAAYDPELDRKLALKLLRPGDADHGTEGRTRLLREAQAMAKLAHPNVITVHDVGSFGDQVFVAMEFVDGETLTDWLKRGQSWRAVLDVFLHAARGLVAAHATDLVHRDFKPDNVMVGTDGRVRVMDFGLARTAPEQSERSSPSLDDTKAKPGMDALRAELTQAGSMLGTPAYMAPEQHLGLETDARADQFSFCVALWEGLFGERPFGGETMAALAFNVTQGQVREPGDAGRVPNWLRKVVICGLAAKPADRYASMTSLLEALQRDPAGLRRRWLGRAGIVAVVGGGVTAVAWGVQERTLRCTGGAAAFSQVWNEARERQVATALRATETPYAEAAVKGVSSRLDRYAEAWAAMHDEVCAATHLRGEQSDALLDLRMRCLGRREHEVRALLDVYEHADPTVVEKAVEAAASLVPLRECADVDRLQAPVPPPANPRLRARAHAVEQSLARAKVLDDAGKYEDALVLAREQVVEARNVEYPPLLAETLYRLAVEQNRTGDARSAEATLWEVIDEATVGKHDVLAALAWAQLVWVVGHGQARYADALAWGRPAVAALRRAGQPADVTGGLLNILGVVHASQGSHDEAARFFADSFALLDRTLGSDHPHVVTGLDNLGNGLYSLGRYEEAGRFHTRAVASFERVLGPDHPHVARALGNLGNAQHRQGHYEEANRSHARALAIRERALGPGHPAVAENLSNLGNVYRAQRRYEEAGWLHSRALVIWERALDPEHVAVTASLNNLGNVFEAQGRYAEAKWVLVRALEVAERALGPDHPRVAASLSNLANVHNSNGEHAEAKRGFTRSLAIFERVLGLDHPMMAGPLTGLGQTLIELDETEPAIAVLERALFLHEREPGKTTELAIVRFELARALTRSGGDRERVVVLAQLARVVYEEAGAGAAKELAMVEDWLNTRVEP